MAPAVCAGHFAEGLEEEVLFAADGFAHRLQVAGVFGAAGVEVGDLACAAAVSGCMLIAATVRISRWLIQRWKRLWGGSVAGGQSQPPWDGSLWVPQVLFFVRNTL